MCHLCAGKPFLQLALRYPHPNIFAQSRPNDPSIPSPRSPPLRLMAFVGVACRLPAAAQIDAPTPVSHHHVPTWTSICASATTGAGAACGGPADVGANPRAMTPPAIERDSFYFACVQILTHVPTAAPPPSAAGLFVQSVQESEGNFPPIPLASVQQ